MSNLRNIIKGVKFVWQNKDDIGKFKKELLDVKTKIEEAKKDGNVSREEMAGIIREITDVLDLLADMVEKE